MPSVFSIHLYIELGITHCYGNFPGSLKLKPSENRKKWQGNRENINFPKAIFFGIYELGLLGGKHGSHSYLDDTYYLVNFKIEPRKRISFAISLLGGMSLRAYMHFV